VPTLREQMYVNASRCFYLRHAENAPATTPSLAIAANDTSRPLATLRVRTEEYAHAMERLADLFPADADGACLAAGALLRAANAASPLARPDESSMYVLERGPTPCAFIYLFFFFFFVVVVVDNF
jgi:hypothetical protein